MLIGMYEHLEQAHSAIRELQQALGLTCNEIGCVFKPSDIRVPPLFRRAFNWLLGPADCSCDQTCNAEILSRMILPRGLRSRALDLLQRGGALVSVSNRAKASEADLFRVLSAAGAAELVVVRNQRITSPVRPRPTTTQENQVKVVGALEDLIEQTEAAGGRSALS